LKKTDTQLKSELLQTSKSNYDLFIKLVKSGEIDIEFDVSDKKFIGAQKLYEIFRDWCFDNG
jgi:hypothetical protein